MESDEHHFFEPDDGMSGRVTRNIVGLVVIVLALLLVKSCFFPTRTHRPLRVTAEIDTPMGLRTGSSVIDFVYETVPKWLPGSLGFSRQLVGEAPVVDLGGGRFLIVLLHDQHWNRDVATLLDARRRHEDGTVKETWLPMLVTFTDPSDATSIVEVSPKDLASAFGPGYALRRIVAEPSTDRPSFGGLKQIPAVRDRILHGSAEGPIAPNPTMYASTMTARQLTRMAFQQSAPK